jgi:hypothetical protein
MKVRVHNTAEDVCTTLEINNNDLHMEPDVSLVFLDPNDKEELIAALSVPTMSEGEVFALVAGKGMAVGGSEAEISQEDLDAELSMHIYKGEKEL